MVCGCHVSILLCTFNSLNCIHIFQGVDRVMVPMQSNWFEWEIKAIITFLLDGHLCNLPEGRILPDIQVEVKVMWYFFFLFCVDCNFLASIVWCKVVTVAKIKETNGCFSL